MSASHDFVDLVKEKTLALPTLNADHFQANRIFGESCLE
jgi:hypothetical protein